jgi:hypothetical protein
MRIFSKWSGSPDCASPREGKAKRPSKGGKNMFWGKKSAKDEKKLSGPQDIPDLIQKHLAAAWKLNPDLAKILRGLMCKNGNDEKAFHIRIFDGSEARAKKVEVKDYTSLDEHPDLIIYEGEFDESTKQVKLQEKKKVIWDIPFSTQEEIQKKIETLRGASIIEFNPNYPGKKQKKYNVYSADVIDMQPAEKGQKLFDSDKPKDIARWVKEAHHKRMY